MPEKPSPTDAEIDRLVSFWQHQNELLWGRLQTISTFELGVIAGWYYLLFEKNRPDTFLAMMVALVGLFLSFTVSDVIWCDLANRKEIGDRIEDIEDEFKIVIRPRPPKRWIHGHQMIKIIASAFCFLNFVLLIWAVCKRY